LPANPSIDEDDVREPTDSRSVDSSTISSMERPLPEKPRRSMTNQNNNKHHHSSAPASTDLYDHADHHTFATATTASATISYSASQGDASSDVSEAGMEVVMSKDHHHHHHHHHGDGAAAANDSARGEGTGGGIEEATMESNSSGAGRVLSSSNNMNVAPRMPEPYASHSFQAGKHTFTVDTRYSMIRVIGSGAYGVVISAKDSKTDENVAIKMVPKAFSDEIDAKRILREIKLLNHFRHDNIVSLIDMMPPNVKYVEDFIDVYLVADLMETDLHRIIYSKQKLSIDHVQYFMYQTLRGLKYIHSCKVLHRDLKPSNLLVNSNCDLKICDFGLARGIPDEQDLQNGGTMLLTEYVVTRWYRAPEIMLACHEYSYPIDVWSVGCIFAELILRKPYFPGDDYIDQVRDIDAKLYCALLS